MYKRLHGWHEYMQFRGNTIKYNLWGAYAKRKKKYIDLGDIVKISPLIDSFIFRFFIYHWWDFELSVDFNPARVDTVL